MSYDSDNLDSLLGTNGKGEELLKIWGGVFEVLQNVSALDVTERQRARLVAAKTMHFIREDNDNGKVNSPTDVYNIVSYLGLEPQENLIVIGLDRKNRILGIYHIYKGSVGSSQVRVGELFKEPIIHGCSSIVVCHNHPSGDPTPSPDDVAVTRAIVQAGKLLDIEVVDHMVVGSEGKWASLKERGFGF